jgi:hypothetical protein
MLWEERHLHEFQFPAGDERTRIGIPDDEFEEDAEILTSWGTPLRDWFGAAPARCLYVYDFGDHWVHTVTLEARRPAEPGQRYPRCTGGERRCPPEDVGGPPGYSQFLEAMSNRRHSEHQSYLQWVGGPWDPEEFRPERRSYDSYAWRTRRTMGARARAPRLAGGRRRLPAGDGSAEGGGALERRSPGMDGSRPLRRPPRLGHGPERRSRSVRGRDPGFAGGDVTLDADLGPRVDHGPGRLKRALSRLLARGAAGTSCSSESEIRLARQRVQIQATNSSESLWMG